MNAEPEFKEAIEEGWANGRSSIRREQFKLLQAGNATMAVWLGKQYLDQRDQASLQHSGPGGRPLMDLLTARALLHSVPDDQTT